MILEDQVPLIIHVIGLIIPIYKVIGHSFGLKSLFHSETCLSRVLMRMHGWGGYSCQRRLLHLGDQLLDLSQVSCGLIFDAPAIIDVLCWELFLALPFLVHDLSVNLRLHQSVKLRTLRGLRVITDVAIVYLIHCLHLGECMCRQLERLVIQLSFTKVHRIELRVEGFSGRPSEQVLRGVQLL